MLLRAFVMDGVEFVVVVCGVPFCLLLPLPGFCSFVPICFDRSTLLLVIAADYHKATSILWCFGILMYYYLLDASNTLLCFIYYVCL